MSDKVEVRTELILAGVEKNNRDLAEMKAKFDQTSKGAEQARLSFGEWAATASHLANVVGVNLSSIAEKVKQLGGEFVDAGHAAEAGDVALATMIQTAQGGKLEDAVQKAQGIGDAFDEMAVRVGISNEALGNAFQVLAERSDATDASLGSNMGQLQNLAQIASKLGKDVGALASEYSLMGEGMLRTRGQLFQLLQSTGIFGKDTKKAAAAWGELTDAKRAELLKFGLDKIGGDIAKMPGYFGDASDALSSMVRMAKEKVGEPIVKELTPAVQGLAEDLYKLGPDIEDFGRLVAKELGGSVREGGRWIKESILWLKDHKAEIAADLKAAAQHVRDAIGFVLAHKEEIAVAFGAKAAMPLLKPAAGVVADVARAGYGGAGGGVAGFGASGVPGATASLGAFAAAIAAVGLAADQSVKLARELADAEDTRLGGLKRLQELSATGDVERTENAVRTMAQLDEAAGRMTPQLRQFYDSMVEGARRTQQVEADSAEHLRKQIAIGATGSSNADAMRGAGGKASADVQGYAMNQEWILLNAYNQAMQAGNKQMALLAAQTIASGALVGDAFLKTAKDVEGGFAAMAEMLAASGDQFAGFASKLKDKGAVPAAPKIVMTGGQTFNVKQDFRDKDPDKIAVVFRRDVGRVIERRASARYSGPFGT